MQKVARSELTTSSTANSSVTSTPAGSSSSRNTTNQNSSQAVTQPPQIVATRPSSSGRTHRTAGPKICLTSECPPVASTSETATAETASTLSSRIPLLGIATATTAMPTSLINATDLSPMANTAGETTAAEAATGSSTITTYLQGMSSSAQTTSTVSTTPAVDKPSCNPLDVVISFDASTSSGKQNFVR
ncbi:unnamed protein product, partial [Anisakis simplex]|uniref:VWFA domain-containing protein n=1 Tax=Anisakis simplex TaxID=6269 RepID=A0A0M3JH85_ANISI